MYQSYLKNTRHKKKCTLVTVEDNRTYNIVMKNSYQYCRICCRRSGNYHAYCGPRGRNRVREFRTWKHNRKTQWKE